MSCGRTRAARSRRPAAVLLVPLVAALGAVGCADDSDDDADSGPPIATVHGIEIHASDVEALAADPGFLAFIGAPVPDGSDEDADDDADDDEDVSRTEAGRDTLTWLIGKALVDAELAVQELSVEEETLDQAEDDLEAGDVPDDVDAIVDGDVEMDDDASAETAEALAAYVTLDEWLRTIDPTDTDLHERIVTEHPEVADAICGAALSVDEEHAATVRDQLQGGASLDQVAGGVPTLSRTPPGGECLSRGWYPRALVDLLYETPVGSAGEKTVRSRTTGQPVVFFVTPFAHLAVEGPDLDAVVDGTLERLHDDGGAAFAELAYSTVDPELDPSWGTWDPTVGVVAADAAPTVSVFDLPDPTTTTAAPPPPPAQSSEFAASSEATLGTESGDPGTGDLVARAQAALDNVIPATWRQALPVSLSIIDGPTSLSWTDGRIEVGSAHATGDWHHLQGVMGHEFGHQVGFRYGSQAHIGAAPTGWPPSGETPVEEAWAHCVSASYITDYPCGGPSLPWTADWMGAGPGAHPRTG